MAQVKKKEQKGQGFELPHPSDYRRLLKNIAIVLEEGFALMDVRLTELVERLPKPEA